MDRLPGPGTYGPGGATGDDAGGLAVGPPDDPAQVSAALDLLQGSPDRPFLVRAYTHFDDTTRPCLFHRFGLTTDDHAPKPAFDALRALVARHGG
ncbi:hypothetical protein C0R01_20785 [Streptomyces albidoflavus]|nr:hypothetical protein C0R00_20830 [Streptomyces albidoflavus]RZE73503.1 hypothetical protein C0R01_20785 [Streptomyces albidoflavus]